MKKRGKDDDSSRIFRTRSNIYKYGGESFFPEAEHVPYRTIPDCIDATANENVDFAVVPLENAIEGSVNITVDYLVHERPLSIVGEITVPIQQIYLYIRSMQKCGMKYMQCILIRMPLHSAINFK